MDMYLLAALPALIWAYLLVGRGGFWRCLERDDRTPADPPRWPAVAAVIPARNEADCIGATIRSLLAQDYPGPFTIVLVDDDSDDGTADAARRAADGSPHREVKVVRGRGPAPGWTGKLYAVKQGIEAALPLPLPPEYLLLTDADIVHAPDSLRWLVSHAEAGGRVLTSFMAKLRCESLAERSHVPAFVFFFQMLFPFSWVNDPSNATAAAAGGCMLVRADALRAAGGIDSIRGALIDDCSLAQRLKPHGPIWLGLTERVDSIRRYESFDDVRRMISRSAYAQLRYSPVLLAGTALGMALTFLVAPALTLLGGGAGFALGLAAWAMMALAFQPMLRFYRVSPLWGVALPAIALLYMAYTLDSAFQYARGKGGSGKGRAQANVARS
jgi:hopene-associated glycosyltransferase HpnB